MKGGRIYDLEQRTLAFAKRLWEFVKKVVKDFPNVEYCRQVVRSSGSIGANYIEANESLGKKDFRMHIRISKKEAKETIYWLELISSNESLDQERLSLVSEASELMKIFGAISVKSEQVFRNWPQERV